MSTMDTRYEVGNAWQQEHARTFAQSENIMRDMLKADPSCAVSIFDRMAKQGTIAETTYVVTVRTTHTGKTYQYTGLKTRRRAP